MTDKIKPALTPEEWASFLERREVTNEQLGWACEEVMSSVDSVNRHGLAALALNGRPYGFTREDVDMLRHVLGPTGPWSTGPLDHLELLLARIEALLPPDSQ